MPTVLLVHSDLGVRSEWAQLLRGLGVGFRTAPNLAAASAIMAREPIATIVADLDGDDGIAELQWAANAFCQPPLVLVSSHEVPSMASRAAGVAVVRPDWPCALRYAVRTLLAARSGRASLPMRTPPAMAMKWSMQLGAEPIEDDTWTGDHALDALA